MQVREFCLASWLLVYTIKCHCIVANRDAAHDVHIMFYMFLLVGNLTSHDLILQLNPDHYFKSQQTTNIFKIKKVYTLDYLANLSSLLHCLQ